MGKILSGYLLLHPPIIVEEIGRGQERKLLIPLKAVEL